MSVFCLSFVILFQVALAISSSDPELFANKLQEHDALKLNNKPVAGKKVTVVSFKLDAERERRSITFPEGESILEPYRELHGFVSPFEDNLDMPLNDTILRNQQNARIEEERNIIEDVEKSLAILKEDLEEDEAALLLFTEKEPPYVTRVEAARKRKKKREKMKRRERIRKERKKKRKERRKQKSLKRMEDQANNRNSNKLKPKLLGNEACQYKRLRRCAKKLKLLPKKDVPVLTDFQKCSQRKKFLECIEIKMGSRSRVCTTELVARGNLSGLRNYIRKLFWTSSSCLLNEALRGR